MKVYRICFLIIALVLFHNAQSQLITYSNTDDGDPKDLDFEIVGKLNGNIHVYKSYRDQHFITLYGADMQQVSKEKLDFLPSKIIHTDFILYSNFYYLFYQYQKRSVVYCMGVKFDNMGKKVGDPIQLDTTTISFSASNKIYTIINSEDKQRLMLVKINRPSDKTNQVTTVLFGKELQLLKKTSMTMQMEERHAMLSEFEVDNDGDLGFIKAFGTGQSEIVNKLFLVTKPALADTISITDVNLNGIYLDDTRLKVDNANKHYLITSFYSKQRRGNVEGFFCYLWDKVSRKEFLNTNIVFTDELRADAKTEGSIKAAFNNYYLKNIIIKHDGSFLLAAEAAYTSSNGNDVFNRWDGFGNGMNSGFNNYSVYGANNIYSNPFYRGYSNITRYFADNIVMLSVDIKGKLEWSNVIHKSQEDDNTDNFISYNTLNTGDKVHFLFNLQEKRQNILTDQSISPEGQIIRSPTLRGLDKGYEFMPRHSKQTGIRQIIVPCLYRNYLCFAKIDF